MSVTTMNKPKPRDKRFLGQVLKACPNLGEVWMNEDKPGDHPFVCISHRGTWTVTVGMRGHKFVGEGPTERKARIDFTNRLAGLRKALTRVKRLSKAD